METKMQKERLDEEMITFANELEKQMQKWVVLG
jgi:hypothetical protein